MTVDMNREDVVIDASGMVYLKTIIADLTDPDPCSLDHSGNCQAHGWFGETECPHARSKQLFAGRGGSRLLDEAPAMFSILKAMTKSIDAALAGSGNFNDSLLLDAKALIAKVEAR